MLSISDVDSLAAFLIASALFLVVHLLPLSSAASQFPSPVKAVMVSSFTPPRTVRSSLALTAFSDFFECSTQITKAQARAQEPSFAQIAPN